MEGGSGKAKEDVSLPRATMAKIIKEMFPPELRVANELRELLTECCVEFINLVSSEANEICNKEERKTIAPEHILKALETLGFNEYIAEVAAAYEQHKAETMESPKASGRWAQEKKMSDEEAIAAQQKMFAEARARMQAAQQAPP